MNKLVLFLFVMIASFSSIAQNNSTDSSVKYFDMGKSIKFCDTEYKFAWSTHPYDFYYLQEYLPDGETFDNYTQMFTVGVIFYGDASYNSEFALQAKIEELEKRKKTDRVCRYIVAENNGEYILDFIVSDSKNDKLNFVEADIHYYKDVTINGIKANILYFYSRRAYGDDIIPFMKSIPSLRSEWYENITKLPLPKF
ncbi:MAG: hypothetical protein II990_02255 [Muribaculaceae bacterium]|nr:hypothetical protein [Muribaculaceae bacterium]